MAAFPRSEEIGMADVSKDELRAAGSLPASWVNKFIAQTSYNGVRLAFGEVIPGADMLSMRGAVMMSMEDAKQLRDLIDSILPTQQ
jgi:hypothetical protein